MQTEKPITTTTLEALLNGDSDRQFRQLVHDLLAFSARLEEVRSRFGGYLNLSGIQYTILISVRHHAGERGVGVKAIAEHLALSGAFVTSETNKLMKLGLLSKEPNPEDRRRVLLTVTEQGRNLLADLAPVQREVNDQLFESLDARKFKQLSTMAAELKRDADRALLLSDYLMGRNGGV